MEENETNENGRLAVQLFAAALTGVAVYATTNFVMKKLDQRKARKEAAANLALNED